MRTLADANSGVPLPTLGWYEEDPGYLGVPFFTMDHVEGEVPADNLPYTMDGWVKDATEAQQSTMWWSGLDAMAQVHRADWKALKLDWLDRPEHGRPGIEQQMSLLPGLFGLGRQGHCAPDPRSHLEVAGRSSTERDGRHRPQLGRQSDRQHDLAQLRMRRRHRLGDGLPRATRDGPWMVALFQSRIRRGPRSAPAPRLRVARRDDRALFRTHGARNEGRLLLRDLLWIPLRRHHGSPGRALEGFGHFAERLGHGHQQSGHPALGHAPRASAPG